MLSANPREMLASTVESTWMSVKRLFVDHGVSMAGPMIDAAVKSKLSEACLPLLHYMDEQRARHMVQAGAVIQEKSCSKNGAALFNAVMVQQSHANLWP
jgi:hypothetical protein